MKNVTISCCKCGKDMFSGMRELMQKSTSVYEANNSLCSDCLLERATEELLKNRSGS